jgi:hypothetical protein
MSAMPLSRPNISSKYRTVEYHDGDVRRIHESRRHLHVTGLANPSISIRHGRSLGVHVGPLRTDISVSNVDKTCNTRSTRSVNESQKGELGLRAHVTSVAHPSPRARAIIFQSPKPLRPKEKTTDPLFESSGLPTPPPTPRIVRLATPELNDVDEVRFCDCCIEAHLVKYCASCGSGLHQI